MREFKQNEDGTWFARETDKPGCMTDGWETREEADAMLTDAERGWDSAQGTISNDNPFPDAILTTAALGMDRTVVVHRDVTGEPYCFHSPLENGPVHCTLCETPGTRVAMIVDEPD